MLPAQTHSQAALQKAASSSVAWRHIQHPASNQLSSTAHSVSASGSSIEQRAEPRVGNELRLDLATKSQPREIHVLYDTMEIVAGALPSLLPKLAELLKGEYNLQKEVKGGIIFLQAELESMKAALEEISKTPADKLNEQDKIWARKVRELSYDIEDKIDKFMVLCKAGNKVTEAEQHDFKKVIGGSLEWLTRPKIRRPNWLKRLNIRRKIAIDIRDIKREVQEVYERRCRYELNNNHADDKPVNVDPRALVRYEDVTKLVGIDEARDEVIKILMQGHEVSKQQQDKIVSIVGFGGLGKTTLANVVYEKLKGEFDCWAFVSVSQTPDLEKIFNSLFYQLNKTYQERKNKVIGELSEPHWEKRYEQLDNRNNASINDVIEELREFLQEKRYLIVIDDIWDISHWKHIRCALPPNTAGCKIITTTRNMEVAEEVGGTYKMKPLCIDSSQILFFGRIFGPEGKEKCPDEDLVEVSNKILKKCAGVPLAIITIAGLLASKQRNKLEWCEVCSSIGTGMENTTYVVNMRNVLLLSYYSLASHIRTCLLYLSMFPEDYEIDKRQLIWMWIAEGFIPEKLGRSLFEVGESYFNELINRSLIQPVYYKDSIFKLDSMMVSSCRVHDVVLDVIHSLSREENFITTLNDSSQKIRRLSLQNGKLNEGAHGATVSMKQVRSVAAFSSSVHLIPALSRFEVVRVLQLRNCDLSHGYNLKYIGKLVHLRFLGLQQTKIDHLPEEIGNLQSLQVLDISGNAISTLPFTIVQLRQLKCLYIDGIISTEKRIWSLTSLEELSRVEIHIHNNAEDPIGTMQQLGHLTKLRVLYMTYFYMEQESMLEESLNKLQNLQHLSIYFYERTGSLEKWVGPQSLRSLSINEYYFLKLPDWINHSHVQNLSFLKISVVNLQQEDLEILGRLPALCHLDMYFSEACYKGLCEFVISAGFFPCLLYFTFEGSYDRVVFEKGAMPRLKSLDLQVTRAVWSKWTEIPDLGFENLPSLQHLHVGLRQGRKCAVQARAALRNLAEVHPNHPSVAATGYRY